LQGYTTYILHKELSAKLVFISSKFLNIAESIQRCTNWGSDDEFSRSSYTRN